MSDRVQTKFLGLVDYDEGLLEQARALNQLDQSVCDAVVLGLEHNPVVTLGVRGDLIADLHHDDSALRSKGVLLRRTGRGGQATLHSPGQLVIYPCVNLRAFGLGARAYVEFIQATTLGWLSELGVLAETSSREPGLFVDGRKLAAFGFQISRGLTSHGIAVNVTNDLGLFDLIRTCGVSAQPLAKLVDFGVDLELQALFLSWQRRFRDNLAAINVDESGPGPLL